MFFFFFFFFPPSHLPLLCLTRELLSRSLSIHTSSNSSGDGDVGQYDDLEIVVRICIQTIRNTVTSPPLDSF